MRPEPVSERQRRMLVAGLHRHHPDGQGYAEVEHGPEGNRLRRLHNRGLVRIVSVQPTFRYYTTEAGKRCVQNTATVSY